MTAELDFTVREYQPGDEDAILSAFNRVFARVDPGFQPRSMAQWRWQFLDNPTGWRLYVCVLPDGTVISQYAGVPVPVKLFGEDAHFVQAVDSFSDPDYVRGLRRPGPFVVTGYPFAANYGGAPPEQTPVMYGLPVKPAWRIGKRFLEYKLMRTQNKLRAPLERVQTSGAGSVRVEPAATFPAEVAGLNDLLAGSAEVYTARSAEHLDWRFTAHPERTYEIGLAYRGAELRGYTVFRKDAFDGEEDEGLVCDWLVPADEPDVAAALRGWLVERARAAEARSLTTFLPDTAADWIEFQRAGLQVRPTRYFIVGRQYQRRFTMRWLRDHWAYTPADTDLV